MADKKEFQVGDWIVVDNFDNDKPHLGITEDMQVMKGIPFKILSIQDRVRDGAIKFNVIEHMGYVWHPHWMRYATAGDFVKCGMEVPKELQQVPKNKPPKKKRRIVKPKALGVLLNQKVGVNPGTASYALRFKNKGDVFHVRDICNARMHWGYGAFRKDDEELLEINIHVAAHIKHKVMSGKKAAAYRRYVKYITQESPWAGCFLKRPVSAIFQYGAKLNVQRSLNELMAAAIALREGSEYTESLDTFVWLIKKGFSPNTAFLTSRYIYTSYGRVMRWGMDSGHQVLNEYMDWNKLKSFFKKGYDVPPNPIATVAQSHYKVHETIAPVHYREDRRPKNTVLTRDMFMQELNRGIDEKKIPRRFGEAPGIKYTQDSILNLAQFIENEMKA